MTTPDIPMIVLSSLLGLLSAAFIARMCWNVTHGGRASGLRTVCEVCGAPHPGVLQVPLLGYLVSRGRCRECGARLPLRFVLCEVWFSALFPLLLVAYGTQREVVELALLSCLLLVAALVDLDERVIPNMLVIIMVFVRVVFCLLSAAVAIVFSGQGVLCHAGIFTHPVFAYLGRISLPMYVSQTLFRRSVPYWFDRNSEWMQCLMIYLGILLFAMLMDGTARLCRGRRVRIPVRLYRRKIS